MRRKKPQKLSLVIVLMAVMIIGGFVVNKPTTSNGKVYADTATTALTVAPETTTQEDLSTNDEPSEEHKPTDETHESTDNLPESESPVKNA
ncbi:hypothetical protein MGH68_14945 [Erysipelothrix sp. D19-032]